VKKIPGSIGIRSHLKLSKISLKFPCVPVRSRFALYFFLLVF